MSRPPERNDEPLLRQFTGLGIWLLVINGMIGAGIFGMPAEAARLTGAFSPVVFVFCGLLIGTVMLCFGEVASYFRTTGGPILYTRTAFGPLVGFQTGWALYVARLTAFAANINLLVSSVAYFWEPADGGAARLLLLFAICAGLTWVNVIGAKQAMHSVGALTVLKFLPLLLLVGFGITHLEPGTFRATADSVPGYSDFGAAALLVMYAYVGFESALIPAGETRDPGRAMPLALFWALGIVTVLYVLVQAVSVAALPDLAESTRPLVDVGAVLLGPAGAVLLTAGVVVSVGGNVAGTMISAPRMSYALAREGSLPAWFGAVHPGFRTPHLSVVFFGAAAFLLAIYGSFAWLAGMSALTRVLIYLLCIGAIPTLRRRYGDSPARMNLPGGYAIPALAAGLCLWLLAQVEPRAFLVTAAFLAVGAALYALSRHGPSSRMG